MAKRLIVVSLPEGAELSELPNGERILAAVADCEVEGRRSVGLLLEGKEVEEALDAMNERWGEHNGFRAAVLHVEAALPRGKEEEKERAAEAGDGKEKKEAKDSRISRDELYADVSDGLGLTPMFLALVAMSTVVACAGLVRDDVAVVVGAMVVAPLLRPNVAMALGAALGDLTLIGKAMRAVAVGGALAFALAWGAGLLVEVDAETPAIARRSILGGGDFALALAAGAAGSLAFTRGLAGPVIGVMVSVALLLPVVAAGLLASLGAWQGAAGALGLALANTICINLAGIGAFLATGVRPHAYYEAEKASRYVRIAVAVWGVLLLALVAVVWLFPAEPGGLLPP